MTWLLLALAGCVTEAQIGHRGSTTAAPRTCASVEADYFAELASIQECREPAECGQVLEGTSCGCTRDLVARNDADLTDWTALRDEAVAGECAIGGTSVCDCPPAEGFACVEGQCTWNYVAAGGAYLPDCSADDGDPWQANELTVRGDVLVVAVSYSGGCEEHEFSLCWPSGAFAETEPPTARLDLLHDANGDACEALIREERPFELAPLRDAWRDAYGEGPGTLVIAMGDLSVRYSF